MRNATRYCATIATLLVIACLPAYTQDGARASETFDSPDLMTSKVTPDIDAIEDEIRIMAKVLEESIDSAGIEDWKAGLGPNLAFGPSFGGHIRGRYVPSVGVLFVIPVAFPLRANAEHLEKGDDADSTESDLWKKYQRSSATYQVTKRVPLILANQDSRVKIVTPDGVVIDDTTAVGSNAGNRVVRRGSGGGAFGGGGGGGRDGRFGGGGRGGFGRGFAMREAVGSVGRVSILLAGQEYDEEKVAKLRATLLETVAEYGHRMGHLQSDERIFVIVESGTHGLGGLNTIIAGSDFTSLLPQSAVSPFGRSTARYQIVVRKRDLTEKTTAEDLEGKIEETEY